MIQFGQRFGAPEAVERALRMARWEISVQMASGAVQGGRVRPAAEQTAAAFNAGMVLQGYAEAYHLTQGAEFLEAGRAGEFSGERPRPRRLLSHER